MNRLIESFALACKPAETLTPWQWCERHVVVDQTSPMPGPWRLDNSPWVREVMEAAADDLVNDIVVKCAAQSSKTQTVLNIACERMVNEPGPAMWVMAAKDEAEEFVRDRAAVTFRNCHLLRAKITEANKLDFVFGSIPFYFTGAGSRSKLQSKPMRYLFLDEVRSYPTGALALVLKRTRTFWNAKRIILSCPNLRGDDLDRMYLDGDRRVWCFVCQDCKHSEPLKFELLKWDTNETTRPNDIWDFDALAKTIRLRCPKCAREHFDTPTNRRLIARTGRFEPQNPQAPRNKKSFHWNALLPPWVPWRTIVEEFLDATEAARNGDLSSMREFYNETLGESWEDELGAIEDFAHLRARQGDYDFGDPWPEETARFMAISALN